MKNPQQSSFVKIKTLMAPKFTARPPIDMTKRKSLKPKIDKLISRFKDDDDFKYRRSVGHKIPDHTREKLLDQGFSIS